MNEDELSTGAVDNSLEARIARIENVDKIVDKIVEAPVKISSDTPAEDKKTPLEISKDTPQLTDKQRDKNFIKYYGEFADCVQAAMAAYDIKDQDMAYIRGSQMYKKFKKKIDDLLVVEINERNIKIELWKIVKMANSVKASDRIKALEFLGRSLGMVNADKPVESSFNWFQLIVNAEKKLTDLGNGQAQAPMGQSINGVIDVKLGDISATAVDAGANNTVTGQVPAVSPGV